VTRSDQFLPPRIPFVVEDEKSGALVLTREAWRALQQIPATKDQVTALTARVVALERELMPAQCLIESKNAAAADEVQYTAPAGFRATVDVFTAYNSTAGALDLTVSIVPNGVTQGPEHIVSVTTIAAGDTVTLPEMAGQALEPGDFISTLASGAGIAIRASGPVTAV
jgi:hypothetical protein